MNDIMNCGAVHLNTDDLIRLYSECKQWQCAALEENRPGIPIIFGALADVLAAEISRRYFDDEKARYKILKEVDNGPSVFNADGTGLNRSVI